MKSLTLTFNNNTIHANNDAWFNATDMARAFNKRPADWLMQR
ncbi:MAG: KilA-N domain-containing protein, partial [Gammaproteobacteria bacterium]|nr:KilA-N domain-containing protein [Gammaproteobacteria bacterium]